MFSVLWYAWGELSIFNSIYVSTDLWHRIIMSMMIFTVMFMAAAIPAIEGGGWVFFALGFAINRTMLAALYFRAGYTGRSLCPMCREQIRNFLIFAAIFAVTAFLPRPHAYWIFAVAMIATQAVYMIPPVSVLRFSRFEPRLAHMGERFALLTLIVLGEGFFKLVLTLSKIGIYNVAPDVLVNFVIGGVAMFAMCWLYFDFIDNGKLRDSELSTLVVWWLAHLTLMLCGVMVGVALAAEVKVGFLEPYPADYAAVGCFGLAGYIAMLWVLRRVIQDRLNPDFARGDVSLFGVVLAIATFFVVPQVPSLVSNLLWCTALVSQIAVPVVRSRRKLRTA
jgi:low temperature requirement protein LtrA